MRDRPLAARLRQAERCHHEIAVLRITAKNQQRKIGSLFLNPGGPGGSAAEFALFAPEFLSDSLLERFDIVGVDPRGIGASANVQCFKPVEDQTAVFDLLNVPFPYARAEEQRYVDGRRCSARRCSTTGRPLSRRDVDRRGGPGHGRACGAPSATRS